MEGATMTTLPTLPRTASTNFWSAASHSRAEAAPSHPDLRRTAQEYVSVMISTFGLTRRT